MVSMRQVRWLVIIAAVVMLTMVAEGRDPVLHRVGGKFGWRPNNVNYTQWSRQETPPFYVGDWLLFQFDKHQFNVLEVNNASYKQCIDQGFIKNITKGGKDVFHLTEAKTYYFLSSGGFCYQGMKLSVDVVDYSPLAAPAPTPGNSSPPGTINTVITSLVLSLLLAVSAPLPWALL